MKKENKHVMNVKNNNNNYSKFFNGEKFKDKILT